MGSGMGKVSSAGWRAVLRFHTTACLHRLSNDTGVSISTLKAAISFVVNKD